MVSFTKEQICKDIFLLKFENQYDITSTFLRFQEHYESPEFRGKIFSLQEYTKWYSSIKGDFTYYSDWNGFNIPSYVLKPFYEGKFNPLSEKEEKILDIFRNEVDPFYVIAIHKMSEKPLGILKHEIAHGFFYISSTYKEKTIEIMKKFNVEEIKEKLRYLGGYHEEVLDDEIQAFSISGDEKLDIYFPDDMKDKLKGIFSEYTALFKL